MLTGATGYLGGAVLRELLGASYQVRAFVRDAARLDAGVRERVEIATGDLLDPSAVRAACRGVDAVFHVAGLAADWVPDATRFHAVNVEGTRHVLQAARAAGVPRVVVTSSVMAIGPTDGDVADELTTPGPPLMPYTAAKAEARALCHAERHDGLEVTVTLPGAIFGAGPLTDGNYFAQVMEALRTGAYPCLPRLAGYRWCLVHVDDVARGHRLAYERGEADADYVLGGDNVPFDRLLETMRGELGLARLPRRVPAWTMMLGARVVAGWHGLRRTRPPVSLGGARALVRGWAFSSARAQADLGYTWRAFDDAFPEFVRWFRADRRDGRSES